MAAPGASAGRRAGFALVLALTVMSLLVLIILSLAGFLTIETRLAENGLQLARARLNAIMAGRIALGHLQQEAGPDQRATATGELAGVPATASLPSPWVLGTAATERLSQGRTRWTGVWRSDQPDQPPAWLISGKGNTNPSLDTTAYLAQSTSLSGSTDYLATQWAPWQVDYPIPFSGEPMVTLVGDGSAGLDPGPDKNPGTTDDIDLRVALPRIPFPGALRGQVAGGFAYWVGDEGVKARVNLPEPRNLAAAAPGNLEAVDALRAPSRPGTHLLAGLKAVDLASPAALLALVRSDAQSVPNVPGYTLADPDVRLPSNRATFHDHTYWSAGVLADSYRGGLRRDLSLAFEMDDREFDRSEYGNGLGEASGVGAATELYTTWANPANNALRPRRSWFPSFPGRADGVVGSADPRPRVWVPIWEPNPDNPERDLGTNGSRYKAWAPVFIREDEAGNALKDPSQPPNFTPSPRNGTPRRLVGPLWHLVRDYYRLYKDLSWSGSGPTLDARAFYPNTNQFLSGGYKPAHSADPYNRYDLDNAFWSNGGSPPGDGVDIYGGTPDPMGVLNGRKESRHLPRAVRGAYMPTIHRLALIFSVKRVAAGADYTLKLFCTPVVVLHNPYNVRLRLRPPTSPEADARAAGAGARISFTDLWGVSFYLRTHLGNDPRNPGFETRGVRFDNVFSVKAADDDSNAENFTAVLPDLTLEPGEMAVLSSREAVPANTLATGGVVAQNPVLRMERGFYITGGFHADFFTNGLTTAGTPNGATTPVLSRFLAPGVDAAAPNGDTVTTWIGYRDMYWHHWLYLSSGWRQSLAGDRVGTALGAGELIGTRKQNSRASYGLMVNIGSFGSSNSKDFFGDPGNETTPVRVGPMGNIRDFSQAGLPGAVIGAFDTRMRVADATRTTTYNRALLPWTNAQANPVPAPNPVWLFSNPLAQTSTAPSQNGISSVGAPSLRTQVFGGDELGLNGASTSWSNLLQIDAAVANGGAALGGASHGPAGSNRWIALEVPSTPPLSLGQLMHANLNVWDWFPYRTVGNSFPPLVTPVDKSWTHGTAAYVGGHTFPDMAWLMNHALWDGFYFSGAAPRLRPSRSGDYNSARLQSTQEVLDAFAAGSQPLANPRMRLTQPTGLPRAAEAFAASGFHTPDGTNAPDGHRRLAGYLLNDGTFNANSLSVEAWTAFLSSVREAGVGAQAGGAGHRFPRAIGTDQQRAAAQSITDAGYWSGFVSLTDAQVRLLAQAMVDEVRARARFHLRTERDQEYPPGARRFRGFPSSLEPGTPFLGLAEFVNRFLGPTKQAGASIDRSLFTMVNTAAETASPAYSGLAAKYRWMFHSGAMESAIARAGLGSKPSGAADIVASVSHNWTNGGAGGGRRTGMPPGSFFRNIEVLAPDTNANRSHTGFGAPGCLFQGDLLQALGPALASRSDTFVIRAHGDGATLAEASFRPANAVLELVVQRLPEYLDARDAPETKPSDPALRVVNRALGRRFKVVAARWLTPGTL